MRRIISLLFVCLLAGKANVTIAQNSIIAGKITDQHNNPLPGSIVRLTHDGITIQVSADDDGLYYSPLIPAGKYHIDISARNKYYKGVVVFLDETKKLTRYYNFRLSGYKAIASIDEHDVFMQTRLEKIEHDKHIIDMGRPGTAYFLMKKDSSGKLQPMYGPGEQAPRMNTR